MFQAFVVYSLLFPEVNLPSLSDSFWLRGRVRNPGQLTQIRSGLLFSLCAVKRDAPLEVGEASRANTIDPFHLRTHQNAAQWTWTFCSKYSTAFSSLPLGFLLTAHQPTTPLNPVGGWEAAVLAQAEVPITGSEGKRRTAITWNHMDLGRVGERGRSDQVGCIAEVWTCCPSAAASPQRCHARHSPSRFVVRATRVEGRVWLMEGLF